MEKIKDKGVAIGERNIIEKMFENGFSISALAEYAAYQFPFHP